MTENENNIPNEGQESLTSKPNPSKLGREGDIFMTEGGESSEGQGGTQDDTFERASQTTQAVPEDSPVTWSDFRKFMMGEGSGVETSSPKTREEATKTAEAFLPGQGQEQEEFKVALTVAINKSEEENKDNSPEHIYQAMLTKLTEADGKESFLEFLRFDVAWASMIVNIEKGIRDGNLKIDEFRDENVKKGFLSDLAIAKGFMTKARKGEKIFEGEEGFQTARNLFLRLAGLDTEHETREEKKIQDVTLGDFVHRFEGGNFGYNTMLNSTEDLARLIMSSVDKEWRTGGRHELIDSEGKFKAENFLTWVRSRISYYHDLNPDSELNLFSDIGVTTDYRAINFGEMMAYAKYFMTKVEKPSPKIGMLPVEDYTLTKEQDNLKDLLMHEVWLFQMSHNFNVKYHMVEGQEAEVPKALAEIHYNNVFTKNKSRLLKILMLSGNNAEELGWIIGKDNIESQEIQGSVGKDVQRSMLAYYYLSEVDYDPPKGDKNMFEEALEEKGVLKFYKYIIGKTKGLDALREAAEVGDIKEIKKLAEDSLKKWGLERKDLNIFNHPKKAESIKKLVKEAMVAAISDERIVFEGLKKEHPDLFKKLCSRFSVHELTNEEMKHAKDEAKYAVEWVGTMVRWMGIQARNDSDAIGFDGWSKVINAKEYRRGQYKEAKSAVGNIHNVFGFQKIGLNFLEATAVSIDNSNNFNRTFLEVLQGGMGDKVHLPGEDESIDIFEFKGNAQRKFVEDHVYNSFEFYKYLTTTHGINYSEMVKRGAYGKLQIDEKKRDEIFRGFWKNARYTYDLPDFLYGHKVRGWWREEQKDENGEIVRDGFSGKAKEIVRFGFKNLENSMFDDEVFKLNLYSDKDGQRVDDGTDRGLFGEGYRKSFPEEFEGEEEKPEYVRKRLARLAFGYFVAKDLWSHRKGDEGYYWYSSQDIAAIEYLFQNFPYGIEEEEVDGYKSTKKRSSFFTAKEFDQIAGMAHSRYKDVFREELKREGAGTLLHVGWTGALKFMQAVIKGY